MLSRQLKWLFALCILTIASSTAHAAPWQEVRTDHFLIYTDLPTEKAEELALRLEQFRWTLDTLATFEPIDERPPLRVYAFSSERDFSAVVRSRNVNGIYASSARGGVAVIRYPRADLWDAWGRRILQHEYVHHFLRENLGTLYPAWYEEGFAEYLSTFATRGETGVLGGVAPGRAEVLNRFEWMESERLVSAGMRYLGNNKTKLQRRYGGRRRTSEQNMLYALGWFAVHYLMSDEELSRQTGEFLARVNSGEAPTSAFTDALGMSFETFDQRLAAYHERNEMALRGFDLTGMRDSLNIEVQPIPELDHTYWLTEAQLSIGTFPFRRLMKRRLDTLLRELPEARHALRERVLLNRARVDISEENYTAALERLQPLLETTAPTPDATYLAAVSHYGLAAAARSMQPSQDAEALAAIDDALALLAPALQRQPDDPALLRAYLRGKLSDDSVIEPEDLGLLARLQRLIPEDDVVHTYTALMLAEVARHDRALEVIDRQSRFVRNLGQAAQYDRVRDQIREHYEANGGGMGPIQRLGE